MNLLQSAYLVALAFAVMSPVQLIPTLMDDALDDHRTAFQTHYGIARSDELLFLPVARVSGAGADMRTAGQSRFDTVELSSAS